MNEQLVFYGDITWEDIKETSGFSTRADIIVFGNLKSETFVMTNSSLLVKGNMNVRNSVYVGNLEVEGNLEFLNLLESSGDVKCHGNLFVHGQMEVEGDLEVGHYICKSNNMMFRNSYSEIRVDGNLSCELVDVDKLYCHGEITGTVMAEEVYSKGVCCEIPNLISKINENQDFVDEFGITGMTPMPA